MVNKFNADLLSLTVKEKLQIKQAISRYVMFSTKTSFHSKMKPLSNKQLAYVVGVNDNNCNITVAVFQTDQ